LLSIARPKQNPLFFNTTCITHSLTCFQVVLPPHIPGHSIVKHVNQAAQQDLQGAASTTNGAGRALRDKQGIKASLGRHSSHQDRQHTNSKQRHAPEIAAGGQWLP
jgi:hypothetical protein